MGGLTRTVNKGHLEEMFGTFGKIKSAEVAYIPRTTVSKGAFSAIIYLWRRYDVYYITICAILGFGYVEFYDREDALKAIDYMHGVRPQCYYLIS